MSVPFKTFLHIPNFFYDCVGIRIYQEKLAGIKYLVNNLVFGVSILNLNFILAAEITNVFMSFNMSTSFLEITVTASFIGFVLVANFKMLSIWLKRKVLKNLIFELESIYPISKKKQAEYKLISYLRPLTVTLIAFALIFMSTIWFFNLYGISKHTYYKTKGINIEQHLPYNIYLPWHWRNSYWYYILNVSEALAGTTSGAGNISSDLLLLVIVTQFCMHLDYLRRQIEEFTPKGDQDDIRFLKKIVIYHNKIMSFAEEINSVFGLSLLFNFTASSLIICFIGFQLTTIRTIEVAIKFMMFLSAELIQVFWICYYGERIAASSEEISNALYNHIWYNNASNSYKKMMIIIMKRAQKPFRLKATVALPISLQTFTDIGNISYKFFAILRTMYMK